MGINKKYDKTLLYFTLDNMTSDSNEKTLLIKKRYHQDIARKTNLNPY